MATKTTTWSLFHRVTEPPLELVEKAIASLLCDANLLGNVRLVKSSHNFTYGVSDGKSDGPLYFARVTPTLHQSKAVIKAELALLRYLHDREVHPVRVCPPVDPPEQQQKQQQKPQQKQEQHHQKKRQQQPVSFQHEGITYLVVVCPAAEGVSPLADFAWCSDLCVARCWGACLARLHLHCEVYDAEAEAERPRWDQVHSALLRRGHEVFGAPRSAALLHDAERAQSRFATLLSWMDTLPKPPSRYGLIHGDLNISNFFVIRSDSALKITECTSSSERTTTASPPKASSTTVAVSPTTASTTTATVSTTTAGTTAAAAAAAATTTPTEASTSEASIHATASPTKAKASTAIDIHVFDWDQLQYGWYAYDLAVVLWSISLFGTLVDACDLDYDRFSAALLEGYESVRPLSEEEREWLPRFFEVRKYFYVLYAVKTIGDQSASEEQKGSSDDDLVIPAGVIPMFEKILAWFDEHQKEEEEEEGMKAHARTTL